MTRRKKNKQSSWSQTNLDVFHRWKINKYARHVKREGKVASIEPEWTLYSSRFTFKAIFILFNQEKPPYVYQLYTRSRKI